MKRLGERGVWVAVALITLGAGALRLYRIDRAPLDPFYDGAVKSMELSFRNFFFGALEPGGGVSIDKPPIDLWLQVASVKVFGFNGTGLLLPEALAGTAGVLLLFVAVRRIWGTRAGLAAAIALALLPIAVITARSDTMDAVMMALLVLAMVLIARAGESGRSVWLLLAGAALGLAFDVKLLESAVALPGLTVFAYLALPGSHRRRLLQMLAAGAVYAAVALSWLTATLFFPAHERPFAYGSTNGSAWNAALVFNGLDRIENKPVGGQTVQSLEGHSAIPPSRYSKLTQSERDHIDLEQPSATRLLDPVGPLSSQRLGLDVLAALLLGLCALAFELRDWRRRAPRRAPDGDDAHADDPRAGGDPADGSRDADSRVDDAGEHVKRRLRLAGLVGLLIWLITGIVLFSHMAHLHPRYTEGFTPAVAALVGVGFDWATARRSSGRVLALALTLLAIVIYAEKTLFGTPAVWWVTLAAALAAVGLAVAARGPLRTAALALALVSVLVVPLRAALRAVRGNVTDTNQLGLMAPSELDALSSYLRAHQGSAHYEVAYDSASKMGALVVHDARPVLVLNTVDAQVVTPVARLRALAAAGEVRYAFLSSECGPHTPRSNADCSASAIWVHTHGTDVSAQAGIGRVKTLWRLPGPRAKAAAHPR
jgi:4-amino-4-deoxy-L-arabinose transferase-like glycosyltransferase